MTSVMRLKCTVGYFVGSLSVNSINRLLSKALIKLAPSNLEFVEIRIDDLPLYNRDLDSEFPLPATALKDAIAAVDAVLFVTPEYNRDIPGGLKNAIDWASRPWGNNSFAHKPSAVIGTSPGKIGTAVAQQNLRSILSFLDSPQMNAPGRTSSSLQALLEMMAKSTTRPLNSSCGILWTLSRFS